MANNSNTVWNASTQPPADQGHYWITVDRGGTRFVLGPVWWFGANYSGRKCWPTGAVAYALIPEPQPMPEVPK